jgi:small subunit ribosomal protein S17e
MGRIKTKQIKRVTRQLMKEHSEEFKDNFAENKEAVTNFADIPSKKLKNVISGYATRLSKNKD